MPRKWRAQRTNKRERGQTDDGRDTADRYKNEMFEQYYKAQNIVPNGEWDDYMATLMTPLPSAFRITRSANYKGHDIELLQKIKGDYLENLMNVEIDGKVLENPIKCLPWYPNEMAWQFGMDRRTIRKNEALTKLHTFLIQEAESGSISRQESVSMIPPLLMDIQPHHKVLDMCAAPGSKTAQLVEALHSDGSAVPDGLVLANDVDNKRCYLLHHEVKRLASPCFMVTNHDASMMPNLRLTSPDDDKVEWLNYDRVLCDVPCSGDGTLRKNGDIWGKWATPTGHGLHGVQVRILKRGIESLAVGGRLVYSTCSMNPIENEAVLSTVLTKCKGSVELVDVSTELPGLKKMPGLFTWKVMSKKGVWYNCHEEVPADLAKQQIRATMFPPSMETAQEQHLERCIRILPHHQNTGGFFVAVIHKSSRLHWHEFHDREGKQGEESTQDKEEESTDGKRKHSNNNPRQNNKRRKQHVHTEDPFIYLEADEPEWPPIKEYFGISDDFPMTHLLVRSKETDKRRKMYITNQFMSNIIKNNEDRLKIINLGVRCFERSHSQYTSSEFRFAQDGMTILEPYISLRRITLDAADIITMCSEENPFIEKMTEGTQMQLKAQKEQGPLTYIYESKENESGPKCRIVLGGWLGKTSCRTFLAVNERAHFLRLCGSELKPKKHSKNEGNTFTNEPDKANVETAVKSEPSTRDKVTESIGEVKVKEEAKVDDVKAEPAGEPEHNSNDVKPTVCAASDVKVEQT